MFISDFVFCFISSLVIKMPTQSFMGVRRWWGLLVCVSGGCRDKVLQIGREQLGSVAAELQTLQTACVGNQLLTCPSGQPVGEKVFFLGSKRLRVGCLDLGRFFLERQKANPNMRRPDDVELPGSPTSPIWARLEAPAFWQLANLTSTLRAFCLFLHVFAALLCCCFCSCFFARSFGTFFIKPRAICLADGRPRDEKVAHLVTWLF